MALDGRKDSEKFGRKQEDAIAALLTQRNVEEAARAAGIGTRTLLRWLQIPDFQKAYSEARRAAFNQSIARLQQGTSARGHDPNQASAGPEHASVGPRAGGRSIFAHASKAIEIEDIEARVSDLERAAEETKPFR